MYPCPDVLSEMSICQKLGKTEIAVIKRVKPFVPANTLQDLYNTIVRPYFDYRCLLWDSCGKVH